MTNDAFFKPSLHVDKFLPEDYSLDTERFLLFLRAYYEWLQTTKITITNLSGTFVRDETVTGTGGAIGIVKEIGTGYIVVKVTSRLPFNRSETIAGETSEATATISAIKDNVVRASGNLQNYKNFELSVDKYFEYLEDELYPSLPVTINGNKRLLAAKFKNFFESRSNEESYRFLFKLLYNENVEFYYPGEDVLRVSDGNFEKTQVIRAATTSNVFDFLNKTIRGNTSNALANVIDIKIFNLGSIEIAEMTLKLVSGTFLGNEEIVDIENESLTTTIYGMITGFTINDSGSGYELGDEVTINGDGSQAKVFVSSISDAPINRLSINEIGHGYRLNQEATINNSGTGGSELAIRVTRLANTYTITSGNTSYTAGEIKNVSITNRGKDYIKAPTVTLEDTTISALGLLSAELITIANSGIDYGVGNTLVFTGGSGANAAGQIAAVEESVTYDFLFEDGFRMLSEDSYYDIIKNEDWNVVGPIARVELTNFGDGYESANLPSITVTTTTGSGANLIATNIQGKSANVSVDVSNNLIGIGAIRALEIRNFGVNYTTANADLSALGDGNANITPIISGLGIDEGSWINDDGKIDYKFIQDSFFYQDFSYVIKSGIAFSVYSDTIKKLIHPAGLQPFGQILISSLIDVSSTIIGTEVISEIQQYIISIESFFNVGVEFANTVIRTFGEIKIEKEIDITSNLLGQKEYVITPSKGVFSLESNSFKYYEVEIVLSGSNVPNVESQIVSTTAKDQIVSYVNLVSAYGEFGITYGGFKFINTGIYNIDWSNLPISVLAGNTFNQFFDDKPSTQFEITLLNKSSFDVLANFEKTSYEVEYENKVDDEISVSSSVSTIIESSNISFGVYFDTLDVAITTNKYKQIQGTVSSDSSAEYETLTIDDVANTEIALLSETTFETSVPKIIGNNTIFLVDYSIGDVLVANNEYFEVVSVNSNTLLIINRPPENEFSDILAYKSI